MQNNNNYPILRLGGTAGRLPEGGIPGDVIVKSGAANFAAQWGGVRILPVSVPYVSGNIVTDFNNSVNAPYTFYGLEAPLISYNDQLYAFIKSGTSTWGNGGANLANGSNFELVVGAVDGNPFDQNLNTFDSPEFVNLELSGGLVTNSTPDGDIILSTDDAGMAKLRATGASGAVAMEYANEDLFFGNFTYTNMAHRGSSVRLDGSGIIIDSDEAAPFTVKASGVTKIDVNLASNSVTVHDDLYLPTGVINGSNGDIEIQVDGIERFKANINNTQLYDHQDYLVFDSTPTYTRIGFAGYTMFEAEATYTKIYHPSGDAAFEAGTTFAKVEVDGTTRALFNGTQSIISDPTGDNSIVATDTAIDLYVNGVTRFSASTIGNTKLIGASGVEIQMNSTPLITLDPLSIAIYCDEAAQSAVLSAVTAQTQLYAGGAVEQLKATATTLDLGNVLNADTNLLGEAVNIPVGNSGNLTSGAYTPTITGITNYTGGTPFAVTYMRVGDAIHMGGRIDIEPTGAGLLQFYISLPVNCTISDGSQASGSATNLSTRYYAFTCLGINVTDGGLLFEGSVLGGGSQVFFFNAIYRLAI